jgi:hypothetical protein
MEAGNTYELLNAFADKHDLINVAIESCEIAMKNCISNDKHGLGGFSIDEILFLFNHQEYIFKHSHRVTPIVKTRIGLYKKELNTAYVEGHEPIGYYVLDCDANGDAIDDWLIIDVEKNNQIDIIYPFKEICQSLPQDYLRRNSPNYEFVTYVNHVLSFYQAQQYESCQWFIKRAFEFTEKNQIPKKGTEYFNKSMKLMIDLLNYMDENGLIKSEMKSQFIGLGAMKANC